MRIQIDVFLIISKRILRGFFWAIGLVSSVGVIMSVQTVKPRPGFLQFKLQRKCFFQILLRLNNSYNYLIFQGLTYNNTTHFILYPVVPNLF